MILFKEDWAKYPEAVIHVETKNKSFLKLASVYKKMGVENHAFMLALHDPALRNVDPHDMDNITDDIMHRVAAECKINPWYFFREVLKAPPIAGRSSIPFQAKRSNMATYWLFFNHIMCYLIQLRQTGKSFGTYGLQRYLLNIACEDTEINHFTKDDKLKVETISKVKAFNKELPPYLRLESKTDSRNKESVDVTILNNKLTTHIMQSSKIAARNLGRGLTSPIFFFDEIAFFINNFLTLPAALAAAGDAVDSAKQAGAPYGTIFMTTAGFLNTPHGEYAHSLFESGMKFTEKLFDAKNIDDLETIIKRNSRSSATGGKIKLVSMEFNHRQLGYTDEWLRDKMASALSDGENAESDYLNIWQTGSDSAPLPPEMLNILKDSSTEPIFTEITNGGFVIRWYITEEEVAYLKKNTFVVIGLDTSDAVGKDDIAMCIRDVRTGKTVGVGIFNEVNIIVFAEWLSNLAIEIVHSVLVIERRSTGVTIIDHLLRFLPANGVDPFKKIFNWVVDDFGAHPKRFEEIDMPMNRRHITIYDKYRPLFGYATSGSGRSSRDNLYGRSLLASVKYTGHVAHDKELVGQITSLITKNGRIDHAAGSNDDIVIAWLLTYWFLVYAKNIGYYGIQPRSVLSVVVSKLESYKGGEADEIHRAEQEELKLAIEALFEKLRKEGNDHKAYVISNKIKHLSKDLDRKMIVSFNVDAALEEIEENRKENNRQQNYNW